MRRKQSSVTFYKRLNHNLHALNQRINWITKLLSTTRHHHQEQLRPNFDVDSRIRPVAEVWAMLRSFLPDGGISEVTYCNDAVARRVFKPILHARLYSRGSKPIIHHASCIIFSNNHPWIRPRSYHMIFINILSMMFSNGLSNESSKDTPNNINYWSGKCFFSS